MGFIYPSQSSPPLPTPAPGQNILPNGNFSSGTAGWNQLVTGGSMAWAVYPNSGAPSSPGSGANGPELEMNTTQAGNSVYQDVSGYTFSQGASYLAGVWVRNNSNTPLTFTFAVFELGGTQRNVGGTVSYQVGDGGWHFLMVQRTLVNGNDTALRVQMYMDDTPGSNYDMTNAFLMVQPATSALYSAQFLGQTAPPAHMMPGQQATASFTFKNTGQLPWYRAGDAPPGNNAVSLGTAEPHDRNSPFDSGTWADPGRILMDQPMVPPGGTATFTYVATAPQVSSGNYTEWFDPVLNCDQAQLPCQWFGTEHSWTTSVNAVGCGSSRADQYVDAFNRLGGLPIMGAPSLCAAWFDPANPNLFMTIQHFDDSVYGPSFITQDEPADVPAGSIPAFVTRSGIGGAYLNKYTGPHGPLGIPTSDEYSNGSSAAENFTNGIMVWNNGSPILQGWPTTFTGWKAEYWDRPNTFDGQNAFVGPPTYVDDEPSINYDWGTDGPANGQIGVWPTHFSARWTRTLSFDPGSYTFTMTVDDGGRLYIDGTPVIDQWHDAAGATYTWTGNLSGSHTVEMDYYQGGGGAEAHLSWTENAAPVTLAPTDTPLSAGPNTPTFTPTPTATDTSTATATPTNTNTPVPPTSTPTDTPSSTPTNTPTDTPTDTPSSTPTNTPTDTPTDTPTNTPTDSPTNTAIATPTSAPTGIPTAPASPTMLPPTATVKTPVSNPQHAPAAAPTAPSGSLAGAGSPKHGRTIARRPHMPVMALAANVTPRVVASGRWFTVAIRTTPRAHVSLLLQLPVKRTMLVKKGARRVRVTRTVRLQLAAAQGTAGKRGQFSDRLYVGYTTAKPVKATLTATAWLGRQRTTRTMPVTIQRAQHHVTVRVSPRVVVGGRPLTVAVDAVPRAPLALTLRVVETRVRVTRTTRARKRVTSTVPVVDTIWSGHADAKGRATHAFHVPPLRGKTLTATLTVTASLPHGADVQTIALHAR